MAPQGDDPCRHFLAQPRRITPARSSSRPAARLRHSSVGPQHSSAQTFAGAQHWPLPVHVLPFSQQTFPPQGSLPSLQRQTPFRHVLPRGQQRPPQRRSLGQEHVCSFSSHSSFGPQHAFWPQARSFGQHRPFSRRHRSSLAQQADAALPFWPGSGSKTQHSSSFGQQRLIVAPEHGSWVVGQHRPISGKAQNSRAGSQQRLPQGSEAACAQRPPTHGGSPPGTLPHVLPGGQQQTRLPSGSGVCEHTPPTGPGVYGPV